MAFLLSPGVNVSEIDLTTVIPQVGVSTGAFAGHFQWGPIDEIMTFSDEVVLASRVGPPDANTFTHFFTAANFLAYTNNLQLIRVPSASHLNAVANGSGVLIKNRTIYDASFSTGANTYGSFAAKYAGPLGNSLQVSLYAGPNTTPFNSWIFNSYFNGAPGTSTYANTRSGTNDELHVIVIDQDGAFSGVANSVLETFGYMSKAQDAQNPDGTSNYYPNVINDKSKYIYWMAHPSAANATNWGSVANGTSFGTIDNVAYTLSLANGAIGIPVTGNVQTSFGKFTNKDETDISLVMNGPHSNTTFLWLINNLAEVRQDCVVFGSPTQTNVVNNSGSEATAVVAERNSLVSSSYAFFDCNYKYQYDKYNDVNRWLPTNGDIAGLAARTDLIRDPWFSFAGFNRGILKNVIKLAWNPNQAERDTLYKNGINPVLVFQGIGPVLYGDKTLLTRPSAFDRINVRRLFIILEKSIALAAKYSLFEFNDAFTRAQFVSLVEPFLRDVQGRRGIFDFRVVCDETNNTPEVIDQNRFIGDIYIKPSRSINFIQLNFIATPTGVDFQEIVGRFG